MDKYIQMIYMIYNEGHYQKQQRQNDGRRERVRVSRVVTQRVCITTAITDDD